MAVPMTVTPPATEEPGPPVAAPERRIPTRYFARLKLRLLANSFAGRGWRIALFILGILVGLWFSGVAFLVAAAPGLVDNPAVAQLVAAVGGGLLVLGWVLLPLVFFGVDETLDPARFALLPLPRRTLLRGLLVAALIGTPPAATLLASSGLVVSAAALGGWSAGVVAALGVVGGLLVCVTASRAVTSAFAGMLRSRRMRDLAAVLLAVAAALLGPLQIALLNATQRADWDRLAGLAHVLGWTPLAAPYTVGLDLADGRAWAVPVKFLITAGTLGALLAWWSRSLESAMVGTADGVGPRTRVSTRGTAGGPLAQLFPRVLAWLPRDQHGALVALHARYWWRDARRRSNLISIAVVGVFVPVMLNVVNRGSSEFAASPAMLSFSLLLIGALAAITLTNQFGFDGSAYAANVVAGVPGRVELRARVLAFSLYTVPLLVAVSIGLVFFLREPSWAGLAVGSLFAGYGAGLAISLFVSILGAYPLPETSNPFALNSGAGVVKSLLTMVALAGAVVAAIPMVVASALLPEVWLWLAAPVGLGYGFGGALLGSWLAGDVLDHQMPELLHRVTPRR